MSQKGKQWLWALGRNKYPFTINTGKRSNSGGIAGSLIGLGYLRKMKNNQYQITSQGEEWITQGVSK